MDDIKTLVGQYSFLKNEDKINQILKADTQNVDVIKKKQAEIKEKESKIKEKEAEIEPMIKLIDSKIEQTENDQENNETKKTNQEDFTKEHRKRMLNNQDTSGITKPTDKMTKYEKFLSNIRNNPTMQSKQHGWNEKKLQGLQDESKQLSNTLDGLRKQKETLQGELQKLKGDLQKLQEELQELQSKNDDLTKTFNTYKKGIEYIKKIVDTFKIKKTDNQIFLNFLNSISRKTLLELFNKRNSNKIDTYLDEKLIEALEILKEKDGRITVSKLINMSVENVFNSIKNNKKGDQIYNFIEDKSLEYKMDDADTFLTNEQLAIFLNDNISIFKNSKTRYSRSSYANYAMYTQYTF